MRFNQLRAFHNVALHGGFSRAANALFLTQPTISDQVRKLEQDCDILLFHRERKRVKLTTEGEQLFILTRQLYEVSDRIEDYLSEHRSGIEGTLRIVADSAPHIIDILSRFRKQYPNVFVSIHAGNTEGVLNELRSYNADIGIMGSISVRHDLDTVKLGTSPIVAFAAKGKFPEAQLGLSLEDLTKLPLVFREKGSETRQKLEEAAAKENIVLKPVIEAEGREAVREIVASGAGIGFVSTAEFGSDDRLVRINLNMPELKMTEMLVVLSQRSDVRVIRAFMGIVKELRPN